VFNLEVDADHCYRVGEQGILVHNVSSSNLDAVKKSCAALKSEFSGWSTSDHVKVVSNRTVAVTLSPRVGADENVSVSEITRVLFVYDSSQMPADISGDANITGTPGQPAKAKEGRPYYLAKAYVDQAVLRNLGPSYRNEGGGNTKYVTGHVINEKWGGRLGISGDDANIVPLTESANSVTGGGGNGLFGAYAQAESDLRDVFKNSCLACVVIEFDWRNYNMSATGLKLPSRFRVDVAQQNPTSGMWTRDPNRGWVAINW
jgi:hypothetical protein